MLRRAAVSAPGTQIRVDAAPWVPVDRIELIANGRVLQQFDVASATQVSRLTQELRVRPERDTWYLVLATSERRWGPAFSRYSSFSFTNPIFVDVDGNGYFDAVNCCAFAHVGALAGVEDVDVGVAGLAFRPAALRGVGDAARESVGDGD